MSESEPKVLTLKQRRLELPREVQMEKELRKAAGVLTDAADMIRRGNLRGCAYAIAVVHKFLTELSSGETS